MWHPDRLHERDLHLPDPGPVGMPRSLYEPPDGLEQLRILRTPVSAGPLQRRQVPRPGPGLAGSEPVATNGMCELTGRYREIGATPFARRHAPNEKRSATPVPLHFRYMPETGPCGKP